MKLAIIVRKDLKLPKGKMVAQGAHAAVETVMRSDKKIVGEWRAFGAKKIAVYAVDDAHLFSLKSDAEQNNLIHAVITDAGHTVVAPGTVTCMGIGPENDDKIDKIIKDLQLV